MLTTLRYLELYGSGLLTALELMTPAERPTPRRDSPLPDDVSTAHACLVHCPRNPTRPKAGSFLKRRSA